MPRLAISSAASLSFSCRQTLATVRAIATKLVGVARRTLRSNAHSQRLWSCSSAADPDASWPLYPLDPATTYVNVGFWSSVALPHGVDPDDGRVNRRIEQVVSDLGGRKSLYSTAFYGREEFARLYGGATYEALRASYDPAGRLPDLWTKTVGRG